MWARSRSPNYFSNRKGAERVAQAIIKSGSKAITVGARCVQSRRGYSAFKEVNSGFGRRDVLVNAGILRFGAFTEITEQSFHLPLQQQPFRDNPCRAEAIKRFGDQGGSIINLSSVVGSHPGNLCRVVLALFWLRKCRSAAWTGYLVLPFGRYSWHQTNPPGSAERSFGPQMAFWLPLECNV